LPANKQRKIRLITKILRSHILAIFKVLRHKLFDRDMLAFQTETRPETFKTGTRKIGSCDGVLRPRPISRLHHCSTKRFSPKGY